MALRDDRTKWNARYGELDAPERPEPHPLALRWAEWLRGGPMLDAACGLGRGLASAAGRFRPRYAVDISEEAVWRARGLWGRDVHWIVGDARALAWPARSFGLVCAFGFTDMPFFGRMPRLLREGGVFLYEGFSERTREVKPGLNADWIGQPEALRAAFRGGRVLECGIAAEPPYRLAFAAVAA